MYLDERDETKGTIVFVLGAGCSADCGAPTMQGFMRKAREYAREDDCPMREDYEAMFAFRKKCLRVSYVFDRWWENIEDLFTQAHLLELAGGGGDGTDGKALCRQMARAIWDVYRRPRPDNSGSKGYDLFSGYVHAMASRQGPRPVLVTTNYDLHLEASLLRKHRPTRSGTTDDPPERRLMIAYDGFPNARLPDGFIARGDVREEHCSKQHYPVEVLKLHGSVNWIKRGDDLVCESAMSGRIPFSASSPPDRQLPLFECQRAEFAREAPDPLIVPPLLGKADLPEIVGTQWKRAIHAFSHARLIIIIGYSFPETDTFMTRLMAEGIRGNDDLERFVIINSNTSEAWADHVRSMFAPSWRQYSVDWESSTFEKAASGLSVHHLDIVDEDRTEAIKLLRSYAGLESS